MNDVAVGRYSLAQMRHIIAQKTNGASDLTTGWRVRKTAVAGMEAVP